MRKLYLMLCICVLFIIMCVALGEDNTWTCAYDGTYNWTNFCAECGRSKEEATDQGAAACAKGYHDWNITAVRPSTCKEAGSATETCSRCGTTRETSLPLDAGNHSSYGTTVKNQRNATCIAKGYTGDTVCRGCGKTLEKGEDTPALGHSYKAATCTTPKTCTRCQKTEGVALGHSYKAATCTTPKTCTRCQKTEGAALGHSYKAATCTTPKTCTRCQKTEGVALGHSYKAATCTQPKTCTRCGDKSGSSLGHNWQAATCTKPKTCSRCWITEGTALGHNYIAATCTTPKTCSRCGTTSGSALGHDWQAATCTEPKTCTKCGITSGSALGHDWQEATYKAPETCSRCGLTRGEKLQQHVNLGDIITFGAYEQDNNSSNGKEPIEWLVLDLQGDKALLISKYAIDTQPYNETDTYVTWEKCTLRTWLNNDFYNAAFSAEEKTKIIQSKVTADKNPDYSTNPGNDTNDNVFLLSINEAYQYFSNDAACVCASTEYARAKGAWSNSDYTTAEGELICLYWWLRSPGRHQNEAAEICFTGFTVTDGINIARKMVAVRPAVWLSLGSDVASTMTTPRPTNTPRPASTFPPNVKVGDYVEFGIYEQDNNARNGKEPIEWLVLDVQGNKALLISRYGHYGERYHISATDVTWETCALRAWLNDEFYNMAFSEEEKAKILQSTVTADKNPNYGTNPGKATNDNVFLLSVTEANKYFKNDAARMCAASVYARARGEASNRFVTAEGEPACNWWLRSPGLEQHMAAIVEASGNASGIGCASGNSGPCCVRPVVWVRFS